MKKFGMLIFACCLTLLSTDGQAKLASSTFASLLKESEVVIEASPIKLERIGPHGAGQATLKVLRVLVGTYTENEIVIKWGDEVHDQDISTLDFDRLLFLKRDKDGTLINAQYGRSYWPFVSRVTDPEKANLDNESRGFYYTYPLTMITFTEKEKQAIFSGKLKSPAGTTEPFLSMKKLASILQSKK